MGKTGIQWTDRTFNPVTGCTKVSAGCARCYAKTLHDQRHAANLRAHSGYTINGRPALPSDLRGMPDKTFPFPACYDTPFEQVMTHEDRLREPLSWRKPQRVFVGSMTDLFHADVPDSFLDQVFAVMALTPHLTYQLLTKRPERMAEYLIQRDGVNSEIKAATLAFPQALARRMEKPGNPWSLPFPNVWLGTTVEDQDTADRRILELLRCPAAVRFVSFEPLLGPVDVRNYVHESLCNELRRKDDARDVPAAYRVCICSEPMEIRVDWGIIGGESGPKARATNIAWIGDLREQFQAAGVPVFVKQYGSKPYDGEEVFFNELEGGPDSEPRWLRLRHPHGGNPEEWAEADRVREFPR